MFRPEYLRAVALAPLSCGCSVVKYSPLTQSAIQRIEGGALFDVFCRPSARYFVLFRRTFPDIFRGRYPLYSFPDGFLRQKTKDFGGSSGNGPFVHVMYVELCIQ